MEFTDEEIKEELAKLGYENVSQDILKDFKEDLSEYWTQSKRLAEPYCGELKQNMDTTNNKPDHSSTSYIVSELSNTSVRKGTVIKTQSQSKQIASRSKISIASSEGQRSVKKKHSKEDQKSGVSTETNKTDRKAPSRNASKLDQKSVTKKSVSKEDQTPASKISSKEDQKSMGKEVQTSESKLNSLKSHLSETAVSSKNEQRPVTWKKSEDDQIKSPRKQARNEGEGVQASWSEIELEGAVQKDSKRTLSDDCPFKCGMFNAEDLAKQDDSKQIIESSCKGCLNYSTCKEPKQSESKPPAGCTRFSRCKPEPRLGKNHTLSTMNSKLSMKNQHLTCFKDKSAQMRTLESYNPHVGMKSSICNNENLNEDWDFDETDTDEVFERYCADLRKRLEGEKENSCGYPKKKKIKKVKTKKEPYTTVIVKLKANYYKTLKHDGYVASYNKYMNLWQQQPVEHLHSKPRYSVMRAVHARIQNEQRIIEQEKNKADKKVYLCNKYVTPTSKKRQALRWQVRSAIETYNRPGVGLFHPSEPLAH